jgi:hypothetical protein
MADVGDQLTSSDPEPPNGTVVRSSGARMWHRFDAAADVSGELNARPEVRWFTEDDCASWTKLAGNYGPVTVIALPVGPLVAALREIMRVTDPGDVRSTSGRQVVEQMYPARRIAREALGLPFDGPGVRVVTGDQLDAERRGGGCPRCGRALVGYDRKGTCPSPYCPGPDEEI